MQQEKLKKISNKLTTDQNNYMNSFRQNLFMYVDEKDITIRDISEAADIPFSTLNSILYGNSKDIKLSTVIKLARTLDISIDELVGAETINPITRESLSICRNLPEHAVYLIRYFIRHQKKIYETKDNTIKRISVLKPECNRGNMLTTNVIVPMEVDSLPNSLKSKIYLGIKVPCEHYMPYYAPGDIILVAADREGVNGERCVVTHNGKIYLVEKRSYIKDGKKQYKYVALLNDAFVVTENDIDDKVGYIVGFLNPDGSWGTR